MIGNTLLTLALLAAMFSTVMYYYTYKGRSNTLKLARMGYHLMSIFTIGASILLLYYILTHNYEFKYIYDNSNSKLSTGLLMSTFYAGQQGSFMLWALFTAVIGIVLLDYTSKRSDLEPRVMMVFSFAVAFLLIMINPMLKSPFTYIWDTPTYIDIKNLNQSLLSIPALQEFVFTDTRTNATLVQMTKEVAGILGSNGISVQEFIIEGKGLNPLLQNFWMQIHPPILFVGFAMSTVPFSFAFAALLKNEYKNWVSQAFPWVISCAMILGLAIMLGGYWAYGVLGWGGYWGWDPVENSSLVPWIIGVASIHTMLVQRKTQKKGSNGKFVKANLILAMLTYILVLYSTFLTRSGILGDSSVHSFVDPGMTAYLLLLLFIGTFTILGIAAFIWRWKTLEQISTEDNEFLSRELALFSGSVVLIASALIIIVGTSMPIFGNAVEISFYNELNLPIAIIMGLLNGGSLYFKWKSSKSNEIFRNSLPSLGLTALVTVAIVLLGSVYDLMLILLTFSSAFTLIVNTEILFKIIKGRKIFLGAYIAHIGMALFLLGVVATGGFTSDKQIDLVKNQSVEAFGYELTFTGYHPIGNGEKFAFNIDIKNGESRKSIAPVMYVSDFNNSLMREPDILNELTQDFYISPLGYNDGKQAEENNTISLRKGESTEYDGKTITFNAFDFAHDAMDKMQTGEKFKIGVIMEVKSADKSYEIEPYMELQGGNKSYIPVSIEEENLKIQLTNLDASGTIQFVASGIKEENVKTDNREILSIEASVKPYINLVWLGVIVMVVGFSISTLRRLKESRL